MSQYLVRPEDVDEKEKTALIGGEEAHHARHAARMKPGEIVRLFDGAGRRWSGRAATLDGQNILVASLEPLPSNEPPHPLRLVQAPPKGDRWEWLIEKAVELGVTALIPVISENSVAKPESARAARQLERWRKIAVAAAKQSERGIIPAIDPPDDLPAFLKNLPLPAANEKRLICLERSGLQPPSPLETGESAMVAVGPEGGFTAAEVELFKKAGFEPIGLGPRILRSETAALAALALILSGR